MSAARFDSVLAENQAILSGFATRGVDLGKTTEIVFLSEFATKESAVACRSALRARLNREEMNGFLYLVATFSDRFELRVSIQSRPDVQFISEIETEFGDESAKFGGSWPCWEFEEPTNNQGVCS